MTTDDSVGGTYDLPRILLNVCEWCGCRRVGRRGCPACGLHLCQRHHDCPECESETTFVCPPTRPATVPPAPGVNSP